MAIHVNAKLCTGCTNCELACSAHHAGEFNPALSRIQINNKHFEGECKINVCKNCKNPACVQACDVGALKQEELKGVIKLDTDKCTGCYQCVDACPFNAVFPDPSQKKPLICDNCDGDPLCIKYCYKGAIS